MRDTNGSPAAVLAVMDAYRVTGPARQVLAAAVASHRANACITVAAFQRSAGSTPLVAAALRLHIPTLAVPDRFPGDPRTALALARLAAQPGTDILQTHGYKANVLAALVAVKVRRPWVAFLHGETRENWKVRLYFALEWRAVRHADRIVVVSHEMARQAVRRGIPSAKIRVVHNACLTETCDGDLPAWRADAPLIVGVVGRLSPEKGVDIACRVHQLVRQRCREARLWIIGEGPEETQLRTDVERLGISGSVDWLGYCDDLGSYYRQMAVLLIPSRSEGLPNVALEAMAHGIPVVASGVGGVPEVVSDGHSGFLVDAGDEQALAHRVVQLLEDLRLRRRFGHQGREEVRTRFSLAARLRALAEIYDETR